MKRNLFIVIYSLFLIQIAANPVNGLLERIDKNLSKKFQLEIIPSSAHKDFFELSSADNKIVVKANTCSSLGAGINWYLKYYANVHLSWNCMQHKFPSRLPPVSHPIRKTTSQTLRYQFNYCTYGYSMPFWDWKRWEQELDWLLLHGINTPLMMIGLEHVWKNVLEKLSYTDEEINNFISGPAFLPWWAMNNLEGWGGPLPANWYTQQNKLKDHVLARMKEYQMNPVLPGYAGMLPSNAKEKLGYDVTDPGKWCGFKRPAFLQPTDANFPKVAKIYYQELAKQYGTAKYYSIDPFHEGGSIEGVNLQQAGENIWKEMKQASLDAVWVIQAWQANPRQAMIDPLPAGDVLVLDLWCESRPQWGDKESLWFRENGFGKHNWLYCSVLNFGGNVGLYGKIDRIVAGLKLAQQHKNGKTLQGVGMVPEAVENNPVMFELLFELPWHSNELDVNQWVRSYATNRYGKNNTQVQEAWSILSKTVYNSPTIQEGTSESIFCARPGLSIRNVSCCSTTDPYYNPRELERATRLLVDESASFVESDNYQYDLVDIVRQCLTNKALDVYNQLTASYQEKNKQSFELYRKQFLDLLLDQDKLLSTRKEFMLGTWLNQAKSKGVNKKESDLYIWNAKTLITTWGDRNSSDVAGLRDYSHREWAGILKDYYYPRWSGYLKMLSKNLNGEPLMTIDFYTQAEQWVKNQTTYSKEVKGNSMEVATKIFYKHFYL